jgi:hypothetical protein
MYGDDSRCAELSFRSPQKSPQLSSENAVFFFETPKGNLYGTEAGRIGVKGLEPNG